jgi:galactokinase
MRAEHVIYENDRVLKAKKALVEGNSEEMGALMVKSHRSLQKLYQVSCDELDTLVDIAMQLEGVYGARLTGAGFGGCTVNLVRRDAVAALRANVLRDYPARTGLTPRVFEVEASAGARRLR